MVAGQSFNKEKPKDFFRFYEQLFQSEDQFSGRSSVPVLLGSSSIQGILKSKVVISGRWIKPIKAILQAFTTCYISLIPIPSSVIQTINQIQKKGFSSASNK